MFPGQANHYAQIYQMQAVEQDTNHQGIDEEDDTLVNEENQDGSLVISSPGTTASSGNSTKNEKEQPSPEK